MGTLRSLSMRFFPGLVMSPFSGFPVGSLYVTGVLTRGMARSGSLITGCLSFSRICGIRLLRACIPGTGDSLFCSRAFGPGSRFLGDSGSAGHQYREEYEEK